MIHSAFESRRNRHASHCFCSAFGREATRLTQQLANTQSALFHIVTPPHPHPLAALPTSTDTRTSHFLGDTLGDSHAISFEATGLAGLARDYGAELFSPGELQRLSAPQEEWCSTSVL